MTRALSDKVAIVTGAGRGIGRALSTALAAEGASVVAVARSADQVDATAAEIAADGGAAIGVAADISDEAAMAAVVAQALESFGAIDVLVNNAGILRSGKATSMRPEDFRAVLEVNVLGTFIASQAALPVMLEQGAGKIINVASSWGIKPIPNHVAYCASKAAILHMTRVMAVELAGAGIQVNAIAPGYVRTEMNEGAIDDPDVGPKILARIPAARVAEPSELGPLTVFLASSASDYVTGDVITIDGGFRLK
ncbi:MAG: glucose 1-dehydrogenase [Actinomycetota bacterium]|nr:glucose 1-dehydrogenase [Actinomycetota bacterium]